MRSIKAFAAAAAFLALGAIPARAEEDRAAAPPASLEELDARIAEKLADSSIVGMQVALVDAGGAYWTRSYGWLDKEETRPVTDDSVFRAGSISKSFTGLLAQLLVEDGVLDLDTPLAEAAPDVEFTNPWEATDPVRLVHLAEHTTGWDDIQFMEYRSYAPDITTLDGLRVNPVSRTSRWRPGTYTSYANSGPGALAAAIENATGETFEDLVSERIFTPLEIDGASFLLTDEIAARISKSYDAGGREQPYSHIIVRASGALNIPAKELAKLPAFYLRRGEAGGAQLVSGAGVDRIETPTTSLAARSGLAVGYGLGNYASFPEDRLFHGHNGGIDGFAATYAYSTDLGKGYVIMSNTSDGGSLGDIQDLVAAFLVAQDEAPSAAATPAETDLSVYEGFYRQITPRQEFSRLLTDAFDFARVYAEDGKLIVAPPFGGGVALVPLGDGLFAAEGRTLADRIFVEGPTGDMEMLRNFQNSYRRIPAIKAYTPAAVFTVFIVLTAIAVLQTVLWALLRPFGVFRGSNRWRVFAAPLLGFAAVAAPAAALAMGGSDFLSNLGGPSPYTLTAQYATLLAPLFGALGLGLAFAAPGASRFARIEAAAFSAAILAVSFLFWRYGWLGITVWSYAPQVMAG